MGELFFVDASHRARDGAAVKPCLRLLPGACRLAVVASLLVALQLAAYDGTASAAASPRSRSMQDIPGSTTLIEDGPLSLEVALSMPTAETVLLRYRLRNSGPAAVAVFDRGDRHAVRSGRQQAGAVGAPTFEERGNGDVVLRHVARPAPAGPTGPTSPPTPLALRLPPGETLEAEFRFTIPAAAPPARLRWCLGVALFEPERFAMPEQGDAGEVWQALDPGSQRELCTPWFDRGQGRFVGS